MPRKMTAAAEPRPIAQPLPSPLSEWNTPRPARDVQPGERWTFTNHRSMAQVLAEELR